MFEAGLQRVGRLRQLVASPVHVDERKIIARRAAMQLKANSVVNLGTGLPEGIAVVASEEKIGDLYTDGRARRDRRRACQEFVCEA